MCRKLLSGLLFALLCAGSLSAQSTSTAPTSELTELIQEQGTELLNLRTLLLMQDGLLTSLNATLNESEKLLVDREQLAQSLRVSNEMQSAQLTALSQDITELRKSSIASTVIGSVLGAAAGFAIGMVIGVFVVP